ncbi:MAG: hypothetical protein CMQ47_05205 [Gammaproteobacteria bacterium]|nr:hypothetical protein [Gammaproteobacteria bacterium]
MPVFEPRFGVCYDFRNPPDSGVPDRQLYAEALDQVAWLDGLGADIVWFTEHHFVDDGYLPSWIPVASAMAARTTHVRFSTDICLLPFNHPVRLAEDLAVLDQISNGRVEIGTGMGYAPHEFRGFGVPVSRRVSLMDESIEVLQRCFAGERFSFHGKRFQFDDVVIRPGYVQAGGPPLWIAAMSKAGAERAARFDAHLLPQGLRADSFDHWVSTLRATDRQPEDYRIGLIRGILVTDDRERDWPSVRVAERYRMELYQRFFEESGEGMGIEGDRIPQTWIVGDVETCVEALYEFIVEFGMTDLVTWGAPPGLRPAQMNDSLEKLFRDVVPCVRERLNADT